MASALTAQKAFLNNFENVINRRVGICEDIKRYPDTLTCASNEVDYSVRENIYMLSSDMNLNIRSETVGYNNKILVSDSRFSLGKNEKVNSLETPAMKSLTMESHKNSAHSTTTQGSTKTSYCSRRGKSCFDSLSHWGLYYLVHVSMNKSLRFYTTHH